MARMPTLFPVIRTQSSGGLFPVTHDNRTLYTGAALGGGRRLGGGFRVLSHRLAIFACGSRSCESSLSSGVIGSPVFLKIPMLCSHNRLSSHYNRDCCGTSRCSTSNWPVFNH